MPRARVGAPKVADRSNTLIAAGALARLLSSASRLRRAYFAATLSTFTFLVIAAMGASIPLFEFYFVPIEERADSKCAESPPARARAPFQGRRSGAREGPRNDGRAAYWLRSHAHADATDSTLSSRKKRRRAGRFGVMGDQGRPRVAKRPL